MGAGAKCDVAAGAGSARYSSKVDSTAVGTSAGSAVLAAVRCSAVRAQEARRFFGDCCTNRGYRRLPAGGRSTSSYPVPPLPADSRHHRACLISEEQQDGAKWVVPDIRGNKNDSPEVWRDQPCGRVGVVLRVAPQPPQKSSEMCRHAAG